MKKNLTCFACSLIIGLGLSANGAVTGHWDFNSGDLSATVGSALSFRGGTAAVTTFSTTTIGGLPANVMQFPAASPSQGYTMTHGIAPNGGGLFVNQYTLIMDIMYPAASSGQWRGLFQTSEANANDGDLFVNPGNGIGISSVYHGTIAADTWHRVAFVVDLSLATERLKKFIDGTLVGSQDLSAGVDGRWALGTTALLFTDEDNETQIGFVNSLQVHDVALSGADIASLGGATAAGITLVPEPSTMVVLGAGMLVLATRAIRRRN